MDTSDGSQSRDGLDFIVEHPEYVAKLATALNAIGPTAIRVRKQMFELLAALCAHNEEGRLRTLETLEYYKVTLPYIFLFLVVCYHLLYRD